MSVCTDDAEGTAGVPLTAARATNSATGNSSGTSQANRKPSVTPVIRYTWQRGGGRGGGELAIPVMIVQIEN